MNFVYDRWGNRWGQNITAGSGPQPQLSFNTANNQVNGYTYDVAGNVINDGNHTYAYDAENQLVSIDNGSTASYTYDALNQRVKIVTAQGTERYGFDLNGRRQTAWNNNSTALDSVQYYAGSKPIAYWSSTDGNIHFEHGDWLGTERVRTTANASVEGSYVSLPFGDGAASSGTDNVPGHFALLDQDGSAGLGLSHAMFREYSSTAGRWMSPDPYSGSYDSGNPQSLNRYAYTSNAPLSGVDPAGLDEFDANDCGDDYGPGQGGNGGSYGASGGGGFSAPLPTYPNETVYVTATDPFAGMTLNLSTFTWGSLFPTQGAGGGSAGGSNVKAPSSLLGKICGAVPSGTVVSVSGNGNFVGTAGSLDLVTNGRTGEVTGFFSPGYFAGAATAGGSLTGGYTFGNLGAGNSNFAGGFTGISGGYGIYAGSVATSSGGPASPLSGISPTSLGHVTTVAFGVQTPGRALSASSTFSLPTQLGKLWTLADPATALVYLANQACKVAGH